MASQVKVEPPDVEGDAAFGMNGYELDEITLSLHFARSFASLTS